MDRLPGGRPSGDRPPCILLSIISQQQRISNGQHLINIHIRIYVVCHRPTAAAVNDSAVLVDVADTPFLLRYHDFF